MTRFLAEQLSTAHWFDQRDTRRALALVADGVDRRGAPSSGGELHLLIGRPRNPGQVFSTSAPHATPRANSVETP